jgi:hypothetical protein
MAKKRVLKPLGFCAILIFSSFLCAPFFTIPVEAVSGSYSYEIEGCFLILDPQLSADVAEYRWTFYHIDDSSKGRTEWIDADDEREHKIAIEKTGEYVVALATRNGTDTSNYQRSVMISKGLLSTTETTTTTEEVETTNIIEVLTAWFFGWFSLLSPLFRWVFLLIIVGVGFFFAYVVYKYNNDQRYAIYQIIKKR